MRAMQPKGGAVKKRKTLRGSDPGATHLDKMLDEALGETFPASDPVAITIETPSINTTTTHRPAYSSASSTYRRVGALRLP
jgi:hypothetical protein